MRDRLVEQMEEKQGVTEKLKAENQMMWVGKMNNIIACAEEIVVRKVVYVGCRGRLGGCPFCYVKFN